VTRLPAPARYLPWTALAGRRHIVVDGAARRGTVLALSHWPNNATPDALKRDTSTGTVFAYLDRPDLHVNVGVVTNNHFDEDGLFSMYALCAPAAALRHRDLLLDASFAGDFGTYRRREAVRLHALIEAHADPARSPLPAAVFATEGAARVAHFYRHMLHRLPRILGRLGAYRRVWRDAEEHLDASEELVQEGRVVIEEEPELDLAVVRIPDDLPPRPVWRYLRREEAAVHPFAIHNQTRCTRLVRIQGRRIELQYRYESWLAVTSRRPAARVDLAPFCRWLNRRDGGGWTWEDPLELAPRLHRGGRPSGLAPEAFLRALREHLQRLPPVWDAYHWPTTGALDRPGTPAHKRGDPVSPRTA
jgi:hypothetical protein